MFKTLIFASLAAFAVACTQPASSSEEPATDASDDLGEPVKIVDAKPVPYKPARTGNARQPDDLPPCPGINPDIRRPAGSNCLGIVLSECGADKAQGYVGQRGTAKLEAEIEKLAKGDFRWIPHMTAVTDDLRPDRLNVELDEAGIITKIDCY